MPLKAGASSGLYEIQERVFEAGIRAGPKRIESDAPRELLPRASCTTSMRRQTGNDTFIVLNACGGAGAPLTVVSNWQATLQK